MTPALSDATARDFRVVWDALPAPVVALARDGRLLVANQAFAEATGCARELSAERGWIDSLGHSARDVLLAALTAPQSFHTEFAAPAADGSLVWFDCDGRWLADEQFFLCSLHDITARKTAELAARAQAEQFRLLADNVPVLIAYFEAHTNRCMFANRQYARTFGQDESSILGHTTLEIIGLDAWERIQPYVDRVVTNGEAASYERELRGPDGQPRWIEVNLLPHLNEGGVAVAAFVLINDITKHRLAERAVRESEDRLSTFMQASAEGIVFHRDALVLDVNPPICELLGYTREEMLGRRTTEFVAPEFVEKAVRTISSGAEITYESIVLTKHGERVPVEFITRTIMRNGEKLRLVIVRDIRDRIAAQARIHHLAHHDALTGLPNRLAFVEQLEQLAASHRSDEASMALLFIDLDHFKRVNDSLGHLAGDTLLQTVASRITGCLRASDRVARFGGDEFMVLLTGASDRTVVEQVANKLLEVVEAPLEAAGRPISVSPSIGVALFPEHGRTPAELIQHADAAMYLAKARGRANVQFFEPALARAAYDALVMEGQLAQAIDAQAFVLHFQPQLRARDGVIVGAEALLRWQHPERGLLMPDAFIPVAEQRRLMLPIGQWALEQSLAAVKHWRAGGLDAPVAVNLSTMQFQQHGFVESLARMLDQHQVPGHWLELELTERMLMDDLGEVQKRLREIKALGVQIAVDDFGTGYSSLGHLKELPIDKVKIDRSFVQDLPHDRDAVAITQAIIQLARSLGLAVIAEGVENEAQQRFLADLGCDEWQGLIVSAPLPAAALEAWARRQQAIAKPA